MNSVTYQPNFARECRECGSSPTVIVIEHIQPETDLCGCCFFGDHRMVDYDLWNDRVEATE